MESLRSAYPWLQVHSYDLTKNPEYAARYVHLAGLLDEEARSVPAHRAVSHAVSNRDAPATTGQYLRQLLLECYESAGRAGAEDVSPANPVIRVPVIGKLRLDKYSLPLLTMIIAGLDAFNPCAFFVLMFLLSLLIHTRSRKRMLTIGGIFVLCSGVMYFVFMAAWLNVFLLTGRVALITTLAGLIAIGMGTLNIKDYFRFRQGISLSIPDSAKPHLFQGVRNLIYAASWPSLLVSTVILAVAANSYELLCTAGFPMVYTRILTFNELDLASYYLYLVLYNTVYVIPLLIIVLAFCVTLSAKKLSERQGRLLKLLSGLMMISLGSVLVFAPTLLDNLLAGILILVGAIVLSTLVELANRWKRFA